MPADSSLFHTMSTLRTMRAVGGGGYALFVGSFVFVALLEVAGVGLLPAFIAALNEPRSLLEQAGLSRVHPFATMDDERVITTIGAILATFFVAKNLLLVAIAYFQAEFIASRQAALSVRLLSAYMHQPYTFHLQQNSSELIRNTTGVVFNIFGGVLMPASAVLTEALVIAMVAALLLAVSPLATLLALGLIGGVSLMFYRYFRARVRQLGEHQLQQSAGMFKWVTQGLGGIKDVIILGREKFFVDSYAKRVIGYSRTSTRVQTIAALPRLFVETLVICGMVLVVLLMVQSGTPLKSIFPTLVLFGVAALRLMPSVTRIVGSLTTIKFHQPAVETVAHALAQNALDESAQKTTVRRMAFTDAIDVQALSYTYPGTQVPALRDVSLRIPKGAMVAFVGRSGAGKSTLVDILIGLHLPSSGTVRVNGADIADNLRGWQENIGYVPQTIFLTDDSVRRNVAFGINDADIDDTKVMHALEAAQLGEFVQGLPAGLDTMMGERGSRVSGGQRQRIGIARALYRDPEVLVLDEATTALDRPTADEISAVLVALAGEKTILLIAHQMTTVKVCQQVFLLRDGELAAAGSFEKLARTHPGFQALVE